MYKDFISSCKIDWEINDLEQAYEKITEQKIAACLNFQIEHGDHPASTLREGQYGYENCQDDLPGDLQAGQKYKDGHEDE